jgi:1-hydroxycarotenoid 3,4-desaturase
VSQDRVIVVGAGMGGLAAAVDLAAAGLDVTVVERADAPGGKMRRQFVDEAPIDAGPTVFTMRDVFEGLFADAGARLEDHVQLHGADVLARHAWDDAGHFDLHADLERTVEAVGDFFGAADARGFRRFAADARRTFALLEHSYIKAARPSPVGLARRIGFTRIRDLLDTRPLRTLWSTLGDYFPDPRLRQLFGRYATYVGSSPFRAPATLMLIAHVECDGVWTVEGGMHGIARALAALAEARGARFRYGTEVRRIETAGGRVAAVTVGPAGDDGDGERLPADAVVVNADAAALARGLLGPDVVRGGAAPPPRQRSLSAVTWTLRARPRRFPLSHHTVFFGPDYAREFADILERRRLPVRPTVYVCAQDRHAGAERDGEGTPERLLCLVNAPADGDLRSFPAEEVRACKEEMLWTLKTCGLELDHDPERVITTTPADFETAFPGSGGALYGRASHGWTASFRRPGSRTRVPGLYLASGSAHPGAGVPMATVSGRLAARSLLEDRASTSRSARTAISGGTSTP